MTKITEESGESIHSIYDLGCKNYGELAPAKKEYQQAIANMTRVYEIMSQLPPDA